MNRLEVIQAIIDYNRAKTYLEIGVEGGDVFLKIKAGKKIAVDPEIQITIKSKFRNILKDFSNIFNKYYEMTSDDFFKINSSQYKYYFDIIFIDGLHTYEQSLKDVRNSLKYLNKNGVIIVHDCNPESESIAYPATSWEDADSLSLNGWTGEWSGDVWKTIAYLRSTQKNLRVFVLNCDHGLGVIAQGAPENILTYSKEEIDNFSYSDLDKNRKKILNLKSSEYLKAFLVDIKPKTNNKIILD